MPDLLFELSCEELPASYLDRAIAWLGRETAEVLTTLRLLPEARSKDDAFVRATGTPRRMVVHVREVRTEQPGESEELLGPPVAAAFKEGKPTKAAEAFAAKVGVSLSEIQRKETPKGVYLIGTRRSAGQPTLAILPQALEKLIAGIEFPKTMTWVSGSRLRFARPLRGIVALLGGEVVPLSWNGVSSGRTTFGHPFLSPGPIELKTASFDDYVKALGERRVVVDRDERRAAIVRGVKAHMTAGEPNADIVAVSANLVEWPEVLVGEFEPRFLEIPAGVIVAAIQGHLRAFPIRDAKGDLTNRFAFVANRPGNDLIRKGNERVLKARLSDAHFFYEKDQKTPLVELAPRLADIVFQERLGSYKDKQERVRAIAKELAAQEPQGTLAKGGALEAIEKAAPIMKADLVTEIVGEFPELQGEVGSVYATRQGHPPLVAQAIREAYLPRGEGDALPESPGGIALAIAEKIDNVVCAYASGMKPTGSKDPLGVRRAVIGVLRILRERKLGVSLSALVQVGAARLPDEAVLPRKKPDPKAPPPDLGALRKKLAQEVLDFARGRLETIAKDEGHRADLIAAALKVSWDDVPDLFARLDALASLARSDRFPALKMLLERTRNITKGAPPERPTADLLREPAEKELFAVLESARPSIEAALAARRYEEAGAIYEERLSAPVEKFMKDVFVNDKDPAIRGNRIALLRTVYALIADRFADLGDASV